MRIQLTDVQSGREIGWREGVADSLTSRSADIQEAVRTATEILVQTHLDAAPRAGWRVEQLTAQFSLTMTAEGSLIVAKGTASGTLDITVTLKREDQQDARATSD